VGKETYIVEKGEDLLTYEFYSEGPKGKILKIVNYQKINSNVYNLAFGDADGKSTDFDDFVRTNNKDTEKVLMTVAATLYNFFENFDGCIVVAKGSTHSRTRLYRKHITFFFQYIDQDFELYGELEGRFQRFTINRDYTSFLIKKR
jgi:hypothetical protein